MQEVLVVRPGDERFLEHTSGFGNALLFEQVANTRERVGGFLSIRGTHFTASLTMISRIARTIDLSSPGHVRGRLSRLPIRPVKFYSLGLRTGIAEFGRNHQGLENALVEADERAGSLDGNVRCRKRLGGLLNDYHRGARRGVGACQRTGRCRGSVSRSPFVESGRRRFVSAIS